MSLENEIATGFLRYNATCKHLQETEVEIRENWQLQERVETLIKVLELIEPAEKKHTQTYTELQKQKRLAKQSQRSSDTDKKYNQLLVKYNMVQSDARSLDRNYRDLKERYERLLKRSASPKRSASLVRSASPARSTIQMRSTSGIEQSSVRKTSVKQLSTSMHSPVRSPLKSIRDLRLPTDAQSPTLSPKASDRLTLSGIGRSPLKLTTPHTRLSIGKAASTPTATPSPSARKILADMSNRLDNSEFNFDKIDNEKVENIQGKKDRIALKRSVPLLDDVSPTLKRSRDEDDERKLTQVRTIRGGQRVTAMSPLKRRNEKLSQTILSRWK